MILSIAVYFLVTVWGDSLSFPPFSNERSIIPMFDVTFLGFLEGLSLFLGAVGTFLWLTNGVLWLGLTDEEKATARTHSLAQTATSN